MILLVSLLKMNTIMIMRWSSSNETVADVNIMISNPLVNHGIASGIGEDD